jgi:hypothetical protein
MKEIGRPNDNPLRWGKVLLAAGLLLVAISGVLQLQEVQAVFFPGHYHAAELYLIRHECGMIDKGLIALRADMVRLQDLCSASRSGVEVRPPVNPAWPATLHTAKKDRVYVARKLKYIEIMLQSMQQAIERQFSFPDAVPVDGKPGMEKTLVQIQEIRARCRIYESELQEVSQKLQQLAACREQQ